VPVVGDPARVGVRDLTTITNFDGVVPKATVYCAAARHNTHTHTHNTHTHTHTHTEHTHNTHTTHTHTHRQTHRHRHTHTAQHKHSHAPWILMEEPLPRPDGSCDTRPHAASMRRCHWLRSHGSGQRSLSSSLPDLIVRPTSCAPRAPLTSFACVKVGDQCGPYELVLAAAGASAAVSVTVVTVETAVVAT
jgi:hypothetical protein